MGELRFLVTDGARAAFEKLRSGEAGETFYAYSLAVAQAPLRVTASANSEEGLAVTAERFAADGYGSVEGLTANAPNSLRWRTKEWAYRDVGAAHLADANAWIADEFCDADPEEAVGDIVDELIGALRDLGREDFFGWGPDRDAVVVLVETGDPDDVLEFARDVNPAVPFARLQTGLGLG